MTTSERLSKKLLGLVPDADCLLIDQGLKPDDEYTKEVGDSGEFQLAYAYGLEAILLNPNLTEGDWGRNWGDKSTIERIASSIFNRFASDRNPFAAKMVNVSNRW